MHTNDMPKYRHKNIVNIFLRLRIVFLNFTSQRNRISHGIFQSILLLFNDRSRHGFSPREVTLQFPLVACFAIFIPFRNLKTATIWNQ